MDGGRPTTDAGLSPEADADAVGMLLVLAVAASGFPAVWEAAVWEEAPSPVSNSPSSAELDSSLTDCAATPSGGAALPLLIDMRLGVGGEGSAEDRVEALVDLLIPDVEGVLLPFERSGFLLLLLLAADEEFVFG